MALIIAEGFDHYSAGNAAEKGWSGNIFNTAAGRVGVGQSIIVIPFNSITKQLPASYSTIIVGAAFKISVAPRKIMVLESSGLVVAELSVDASQRLNLTDSTGRLFVATSIIPVGLWFQVEVKVVVGHSGTFEIQLNGASEITSTVGDFGTSDVNQIIFESMPAEIGDTATTFVDDVYALDSTGGSPRNTFLGDVQVRTLYPSADATYTDYTPKTATAHYLQVNESLIDGDGSYVYDTTPGDKDSYTLQPIFSSTIFAAQLNLGARKGDGGLRQIAPMVRQSATDYVGPTETLSAVYRFYSWPLDQDPTGSDWTPTTLNADEFGMETIT